MAERGLTPLPDRQAEKDWEESGATATPPPTLSGPARGQWGPVGRESGAHGWSLALGLALA